MLQKNILFTGPPRCGKSTVIEEIVGQLKSPSTGFFTREIREGGRRVGFSINTLDGKQGVLAHQNIKGRYRVGKYGVNLEDIDQIAVPSMVPASEKVVVVIDEIGKMECFSEEFNRIISTALDSEKTFIATIALKGRGLIAKIMQRTDIRLFEVRRNKQDAIMSEILDCVNLAAS